MSHPCASATPATRYLVDQQLWYFGHDIQHADGNALVRFGFERRRAFDGVGTTCYLLPLDLGRIDDLVEPTRTDRDGRWITPPHGDGALACWGFATYFGRVVPRTIGCEADVCSCSPRPERAASGVQDAGVLLERAAAAPRIARDPLALPAHRLADLPSRSGPRSAEQWKVALAGLRAIAAIFAVYERWARETLGERHRSRALAMVPRHKQRRFVSRPHLVDAWDRISLGVTAA